MQLELLAPAKNKDIGIAAIDCGADAVYIAGPSFGARASAGNSVEDIRQLAEYAHLYSARIYAVVNTILFDSELEEAERLMHSLADAGVDAFIIQDLGILKMDLPKVPLYASTQSVIRTPEEAVRLEKLGFTRLILERQLSLEQIRAIRRAVSCELEFFCHGALCVSYSGQCYLSQALAGRSANRGACIQACRSRYDLADASGRVLARGRSLLSLKDYKLDERIPELVDAGISSFKIEGRLKNVSYVRNVVRHYDNVLREYLKSHPEHSRLAEGRPEGGFTPEINATFNRGYTEAFIDGTKGSWNSVDASRSIGEYLGRISAIEGNAIRIDTQRTISPGDGLAFIPKGGELTGMRVETCENGKVRLKDASGLFCGQKVYRNLNTALERELEHNLPKRLIEAFIEYSTSGGRTVLRAFTPSGLKAEISFDETAEPARNAEAAGSSLRNQLSKISGPFRFSLTELECDRYYFYPASQINGWRRSFAEMLEKAAGKRALERREQAFRKPSVGGERLFGGSLSYLANCSNRLSREVYASCGVERVQDAYELRREEGAEVMRSKYCIKYELGLCPKQKPAATVKEPLYLLNNGYRLKLQFDCRNCEMVVIL